MVDYDWDKDQVNVWPGDWEDDGDVCPNATLDYWDDVDNEDEDSWDYSLDRRFDDCGDYDGYEGDELPELTLVYRIKMWFWDKQDKLKGLWHEWMVKLRLAKEEEIPF